MHGGQGGHGGRTWQSGGVDPPQQGALSASRRVYRLHRRRLLLAVWPVYGALTALGLLNGLLVIDEGDVGELTAALVYAVVLVLAGAFWTMPAVAGALEQGRAAAAAARAGSVPAGPLLPWRVRALAPYRRINTLSWLLLLSCIAIVLVPLVVPARLALALPVAAGEDCGAWTACRRSWRLTRGSLWRTWWLVMLTVVLVTAGTGVSLWAGGTVAGQVDVGDRWTFVLGIVVSLAVASVPLTFASARIGVLWITWHQLLALRIDRAAPGVPPELPLAAAVAAAAPPAAPGTPSYEPAAADLEADGAAAMLEDVDDGAWSLLLEPDDLDDAGPSSGPAAASPEPSPRPGGIGRRAAALAIDLVTVWLLGLGIGGIVDASLGGSWSTERSIAVSLGISAGVWLVYCATLVGWLGQTLGKLAVGVQVVDARTGERATWRQSLRRELIRLLLTALVVGVVVDYALLLRERERRRPWHDRLAGTAVVRRSTL